jgi:inner membrane protein
MDNLSHTLAALMMSRCGLGKVLPANGGPVLLMLAANVPDIDIFPSLGDPVKYIAMHRGYTHSLALSPLMALLPLLVVCLFTKTRPTWLAWLASWAAVLSHLLLDWTNVYGTRLGLPFNAKWYHLDITDVIDPWIWLILLIAVAAPALASLVGSEIVQRRTAGPKQSWAWAAILLLCAYEGGRFIAHTRALAIMEAHLYGTENTPRFNALPDRISPIRWRGVVVADEFILNVPVDLTEDYNPAFGHVDYSTKSSAAIDAAKTTRPFQVFGNFNQLPFWSVKPEVDFIRVDLIDLRFGTTQRPGFLATALITPQGRVEDSTLRMGLPRR